MFDSLPLKSGKKAKSAPADKGPRADKNAKLRKIIGARFIEAREINGWGQTDAAMRLGYSNSTQLSLIERGERLPPVEIIKHAATVYGVSTDYLMGLSDEPDRDPKQAEKRAAMRQVQEMLVANAESMIETMLDHIANGAPTVQTTRTLVDGCKKHIESLKRFIELNSKKFEVMRGGSPVLSSLEAITALVEHSDQLLYRHDHFVNKALEAAKVKRAKETEERNQRRANERLRKAMELSTSPDQFHLTLGESFPSEARPQ